MKDSVLKRVSMPIQKHNKVTIELFDGIGNKIQKVECENEVNDDFLNRQMKFVMLQNLNNSLINEVSRGFFEEQSYGSGELSEFFSHLYLSTTSEKAIDTTGKERLFDPSTVIGIASLKETHSSSDNFKGTINASESYYDAMNKEFVLVFDFPTHSAIGTIQSVGLINKKQYHTYERSVTSPFITHASNLSLLSSNIGQVDGKNVILMKDDQLNVYLINLDAESEEETIMKQANLGYSTMSQISKRGVILEGDFYYWSSNKIYKLSLQNLSDDVIPKMSFNNYISDGTLFLLPNGKPGVYCLSPNSQQIVYFQNLLSEGVVEGEWFNNPFQGVSWTEFLVYHSEKFFALSNTKTVFLNNLQEELQYVKLPFYAVNAKDWLTGYDSNLYELKKDSKQNKNQFVLSKVRNNGLPQVATQVVLNSPVTKTSLETMKITYRLKIA